MVDANDDSMILEEAKTVVPRIHVVIK